MNYLTLFHPWTLGQKARWKLRSVLKQLLDAVGHAPHDVQSLRHLVTVLLALSALHLVLSGFLDFPASASSRTLASPQGPPRRRGKCEYTCTHFKAGSRHCLCWFCWIISLYMQANMKPLEHLEWFCMQAHMNKPCYPKALVEPK